MHYFVYGDGYVLDLGLFLIFCIDFDFVDIKILRIILSEKLWKQILFELQVLADETGPLLQPDWRIVEA